MAEYAIAYDGVSRYSEVNDALLSAPASGNFTIGFFITARAKPSATEFHYYLSHGGFAAGVVNIYWRESDNELRFAIGSSVPSGGEVMPSDFIGTRYLLMLTRNSGNTYIVVCKPGAPVFKNTYYLNQTDAWSGTLRIGHRPAGGTARYAKCEIDNLFFVSGRRISDNAEIEAIASGATAIDDIPDVTLHWPQPEGTGTTSTDALAGSVMQMYNMPVDDSHWVLLVGGASSVTATFNIPANILAAVTKDVPLSVYIRNTVSADKSATVDLRAAVSADKAATVDLREPVTSDKDILAQIRSKVEGSSLVTVSLRQPVSTSKNITTDLLEALLTTVQSDTPVSVQLLAPVMANKDVSAGLRQAVEQATNTTVNLLAGVYAHNAVDVSLRSSVVADKNVLTALRAQLQRELDIIANLTGSVETSFDVKVTIFEQIDINAPARSVTLNFTINPVPLDFNIPTVELDFSNNIPII